MEYGLLQPLLPCPWFKFWPGYIRHLSMPVSPGPSFSFSNDIEINYNNFLSFSRISTQILSHFVEDFTLVSAFVLFFIGCLNILLGLIFRESARTKRSISPWRAGVQGVLPTSVSKDNRLVFNSTFAIFSSRTTPGGEITPYVMYQDATDSGSSTEKAGYGFGRQGEKPAALGGSVLQKPDELLPRYTAPLAPPVSTPTFKSSPTAI